MNSRQEKVFNFIVSQHIKTAQPVGSQLIVEKGKFDLSSATIRNEMAALEGEDLICQPHTSAGRVPTEKGYRFFVDNFVFDNELAPKIQQTLVELIKPEKNDQFQAIKGLAKGTAEISTQAVFVGFESNNVYYTGLSYLFAQPEFEQHQLVHHLSQVIDHLDQVISEVFESVDKDVRILIGQNNPFGRDCSAILGRYKLKTSEGLFGILGPIRMDYQQNVNLVKFGQQLISEL